MLDRNNPYYRQVELVMRVLPLIAQETDFALKGGTAINLFIRQLPRLSVDIDLTYLPLTSRELALPAIEQGLQRITKSIERVIRGAITRSAPGESGYSQKSQISVNGVQIKIEVSPVLRGCVMNVENMAVCTSVADQLGYVETQVHAQEELYAGKLVAALDRQHPRDLFDVKILFDHDGMSPSLLDVFVIYLVCSSRPIAELLAPNLIPLQPVFDQQFKGMPLLPITVEELEQTRQQLLNSIRTTLTEEQKHFLLSFKQGEPEWGRLQHPKAEQLPAVRWKLHNIRQMKPEQHAAAIEKLRTILFES